jgi:hypothetical protein
VDIVLRLVLSLDPALAAQVERLLAAIEATVTSQTFDTSALKAATDAANAKAVAIDNAVKTNTP